jgi:arylsulfatase A-like enzyme
MRVTRFQILFVLFAAALPCLFQSCDSSTGSGTELQGAVLILLDTVRADRLSCYGYGRETSPFLSRLADEGVLFEKAVAFAPWTLPSMVNLFTANRADSSTFGKTLKYSLVESLAQAGIATAGITEGGFVSSKLGFNLGFSEYVDEGGDVEFQANGHSVLMKMADPEGRIEKTFSRAMEWLAAHRDEKFFLYIHTYEAHTPYTRTTFTEGMNPGAVGEVFTLDKLDLLQSGQLTFDVNETAYLDALYDGGISKCDDQVGAFLEYLEEIGLRARTMVVVTSDHGEELGDHYPSFSGEHGHSLFDELLLVPLIVHDPTEIYPKKRIENQVRLMDVMPTILEALGVAPARRTAGKSLQPMMRGDETRGRSAIGGATKAGPERVFARWLGYKSIWVVGPQAGAYRLSPPPPPVALYDLRADPEEQTDISTSKPDIVKKMKEVLYGMDWTKDEQDLFSLPDDMDESLRRRLESLGYIR